MSLKSKATSSWLDAKASELLGWGYFDQMTYSEKIQQAGCKPNDWAVMDPRTDPKQRVTAVTALQKASFMALGLPTI